MPNEPTPTPTPEPEPEPTPEPIPEPTPEFPIDDSEPGGDTPQAVYQRKLHRRAKRAEAEREDANRRNLVLETELRTLKESRIPTDKKRIFTPQEIQAAIDAQQISVAEGADYLAEIRATQKAEAVLKTERERVDNESRAERAQDSISGYVDALPWLSDTNDARRKGLEAEHKRLTDPYGIYRLQPGSITDLMVLERVLGPLDKIRAREAAAALSRASLDAHAEGGSGGAGKPPVASGSSNIEKMPQHFKDFWAKSQTPVAEQEKEAKIYLAGRGKKP